MSQPMCNFWAARVNCSVYFNNWAGVAKVMKSVIFQDIFIWKAGRGKSVLLSLSGTEQETGEGRGGWDDPMLAIPRKRMRIVIKGAKKHVLGCVPNAQMVAVTSARPKMVAGNFRREK